MDKIRISSDDSGLYDIKSIAYSGENLLVIEFNSAIPASFGDIVAMTESGSIYAEFNGYSTVYRTEGNIITLSNDESFYTESTTPIVEEPVELTDEQKAEIEKQNKINEINQKISVIDAEFKTLDYVGIKIATGRATIDEYKDDIARMNQLADEKNELENELKELQEVKDNG